MKRWGFLLSVFLLCAGTRVASAETLAGELLVRIIDKKDAAETRYFVLRDGQRIRVEFPDPAGLPHLVSGMQVRLDGRFAGERFFVTPRAGENEQEVPVDGSKAKTMRV